MTLVEFFDRRRATAPRVVRASERQRLRSTWSRAEVDALGDGVPTLEPIMVTIAPGGRSGARPEAHPGEEFAFVVDGGAALSLADEVHVQRSGDAATFSSEIPHVWENTGLQPARILVVSSRARQSGRDGSRSLDRTRRRTALLFWRRGRAHGTRPAPSRRRTRCGTRPQVGCAGSRRACEGPVTRM